MLSSARTGASLALRARPTTQLVPFRAAAAISSSSRKDASNAVQPAGGYGLAKRERKEVPLASQEGTKGLVQYALTTLDSITNWARQSSLWPMTVRAGVLRRRDDAPLDAAVRPGPAGHHLPGVAAAVGRDDRGGHADQQDGARRCARSTTR
ncbi:hypothetical protein VTK56DRAFT_6228 [Thermocarpiscus australiensis]